MLLLLLLLVVCIETRPLMAQKLPENPNSGTTFELVGDEVGESFAVFVSHHPKAQCVNSTTKTKICYQWEEVSILGLTARPDAGCSPEKHSLAGCAQGLTAFFQGQRLTNLTYAVSGNDKTESVAKLKEKYAHPAIDTPEATIWLSGNSVLSVVVGKATEVTNGPTLITFMIGASS